MQEEKNVQYVQKVLHLHIMGISEQNLGRIPCIGFSVTYLNRGPSFEHSSKERTRTSVFLDSLHSLFGNEDCDYQEKFD